MLLVPQELYAILTVELEEHHPDHALLLHRGRNNRVPTPRRSEQRSESNDYELLDRNGFTQVLALILNDIPTDQWPPTLARFGITERLTNEQALWDRLVLVWIPSDAFIRLQNDLLPTGFDLREPEGYSLRGSDGYVVTF